MKPFARFFKWVWERPRARRARPTRSVLLVLERLEQRCVTAGLSGMDMTGSFGPGAALWAAESQAAVLEAHSAGGGPAGRSQVAPVPQLGQHDDSVWGHRAFFPPESWPSAANIGERPTAHGSWVKQHGKGATKGFPSGSRSGPAGPNHYSGLNPTPLAPEEVPSSAPSDAGLDAAGQGGPSGRAISLDHASEGSASEVAGPGPVASVAAPPDFVSPLSLAPSDNAGAQALSGLNQVVTPSLAVARSPASLDSPLNAQADGFRITRAPVSNATTEVRYALTAFSSAGAVRREYATTIPSGAVHVDVLNEPTPAGKANGREIVTLTLLDHSAYRISRPSVTLFLAGNAQGCSEPALFAAYQEGKVAEAFSALVARHRPAVLQTCFGVLGNWHDAEDVTQMVFLALTQQQLRLQTTLASWLRTVARNASIALLRSRARRSRHEYRGAKPILVASEEPIRDLREHLDAALNQLSAPLREAVQLRYLEGWSQREAAQILGCPRGTLAQRASLGVRHLRGILSQGHESADND